jgi:hypothetical protein
MTENIAPAAKPIEWDNSSRTNWTVTAPSSASGISTTPAQMPATAA